MRRHGAPEAFGTVKDVRSNRGGLPRFAVLFFSTLLLALLLVAVHFSRYHSTVLKPPDRARLGAPPDPHELALYRISWLPREQQDVDTGRMCISYGSMGACVDNRTLLQECGKTCKFFLHCGMCHLGQRPPDLCKHCKEIHARPDECIEQGSELGQRMHSRQFPPSHIERRLELPETSKVILELGGNLGDDLGHFVRHLPEALIFSCEPVPDFYTKLEEQYASQPRVHIRRFGAANKDGNMSFKLGGLGGQASGGLNDGSDMLADGKQVTVALRDASAVLTEIQQEVGRPVDSMSINCEGCEYLALRRLLEQGLLRSVTYLQLSWHVVDAIPDRLAQRCAIESALRETHDLIWYDGFYGWQGWHRKSASGVQLEPQAI